MNRLILLACAVCFSFVSATKADEYLLRVDTIGYEDKPASDKAPKETILRSIEVVARPEAAFHSKVSAGTQTLVLAGKLSPADGGGFDVQIRYAYAIDTGITVATEDGGRKPLLGTSAFQTNIRIAVGDSVTLGGSGFRKRESGELQHHSKTRYVLVLAHYTPADD